MITMDGPKTTSFSEPKSVVITSQGLQLAQVYPPAISEAEAEILADAEFVADIERGRAQGLEGSISLDEFIDSLDRD